MLIILRPHMPAFLPSNLASQYTVLAGYGNKFPALTNSHDHNKIIARIEFGLLHRLGLMHGAKNVYSHGQPPMHLTTTSSVPGKLRFLYPMHIPAVILFCRGLVSMIQLYTSYTLAIPFCQRILYIELIAVKHGMSCCTVIEPT